MKNFYLAVFLVLFTGTVVHAQLTSITPTQGAQGQTLQTIITGSGIFLQGNSTSGNIASIKIIDGIYFIDVFNVLGWNQNTTVLSADSVATEIVIPPSIPPGDYDVEVITGDVIYPFLNMVTHTLPDAFTIFPPDGYVTGTAYHDVNENGIMDVGEPGVGGQNIKLLPNNVIVPTGGSGNYSFPVLNGNYSVAYQGGYNPYMFLTSADTLAAVVNNDTASGNNFGLRNALLSITPAIGYQGVNTTHQIVSSEPIFDPASPNIYQTVYIYTPGAYTAAATYNILDSFTVNVTMMPPGNTPIGTSYDISLIIQGLYPGYHFLRDQFEIQAPPSTITGRVFFDQNLNKINDPGEPGISGVRIDMSPDLTYAYTNFDGNYQLGSMGGAQTITLGTIPSLLSLFTDSASYTFIASGAVTGKDFGLISLHPPYSISCSAPNLFARCNTSQNVTFRVRNISNTTYDALAWFVKSPLISFISSNITPSLISNDTIYWELNNMVPYTEIYVSALCSLPGSGTVLMNAGVSSLDVNGDPQVTSAASSSAQIFCAWDPNDKQVTPEGIFAQNFTLMSDTLEYLIRFQNTGNDTAFNVVVLDTLDSDLDYNSFEILESSHSMQTELKSNGALKFTFNNILLVDSVANEPESHGYIRYRIHALSGLPDSTEILNEAHIFFDFNPAVVTNTTLNTMVYVLPVGINEIEGKGSAVLYPNPFTSSATLLFDNRGNSTHTLMIFDINGKKACADQQTGGNRFVIDKKMLTDGIYFYRLINAGGEEIHSGKMILN